METDPLTTLDEFGSRRFVIPAEVNGRFRTQRNRVYAVLLLIFLLLPWVKINGLQAVLFDIPGRRFEIFGRLFLAHDAPLIFLILASSVMILAFVTAVWGRVWCGWACPQTVFIDAVYRRIEIWVEGNYIQRRKLQNSPMTFASFLRSLLKWFLYLVVSSVIAHSFIAYFSGADQLLQMIRRPPGENWSYFLIVSVVTGILLFNFAWFREQFCTIMCPYGRFQSVLMDADTVNVLYDEKRGEPRKGAKPLEAPRGDCVSCNRCVEVCPAKIDIRKGLQMECIACTACIDACDDIMVKVHKPANLIGYRSVSGKKANPFRPRALAYLSIAIICLSVLAFQVAIKKPYAITVLRGKDTPYQLLPGDLVSNHLKIHIFNQGQSKQNFVISLSPQLEAQGVRLTQQQPDLKLKPGQEIQAHVFVTFPKALVAETGQLQLDLLIQEIVANVTETKGVVAVGPAQNTESPSN